MHALSLAILLALLGPPGGNPPQSQQISSGNPKVTAVFKFADGTEHCATKLYVTYGFADAPAKLVWRFSVYGLISSDPTPIQDLVPSFTDGGTGPFATRSTVLTFAPASRANTASAGLEKITYPPNIYIPVVTGLAAVYVHRPCRPAPGGMEQLPQR